MKILFAFCLILSPFSCRQYSDSNLLKEDIIKTDKAMSDLAVKEGFMRSISHYADENIVKLNEGAHPILGKKMFDEMYADNPGPKSLTWEPIYAEVSESGELGYTWGNWKFAGKDTALYGNYFTVWKKQKDGTWKVVLDGGNSTPPPG